MSKNSLECGRLSDLPDRVIANTFVCTRGWRRVFVASFTAAVSFARVGGEKFSTTLRNP